MADRGFDVLLDVPLHVTVQVGTCRLTMAEIVKLGSGSLLELDRTAGDPVDVLVNGKIVARGEIVAVQQSYGVRITELIRSAQAT